MPDSELLIELVVSTPGRLDVKLLEVIRAQYPHVSRNQLKAVFKNQNVYCNDQLTLPSQTLPPGRFEVRLRGLPLSREAAAPAEKLRLSEVYNDGKLLVVHKTSGIPSVPLSSQETETAMGAVLAAHPHLKGVGKGGLEPGLLHRLDTGTSGLLALAQDDPTFRALRDAWNRGRVRKIYRAIVNRPSQPVSTNQLSRLPLEICTPLGHDPKSKRKMIPAFPSTKIRGNPIPAQTLIIAVREVSENRLDLEIEIKTGVMHQIRCHLASIGLPLLGDTLYGGSTSERLWLHAWKLELPHLGQRIHVRASLPLNWP